MQNTAETTAIPHIQDKSKTTEKEMAITVNRTSLDADNGDIIFNRISGETDMQHEVGLKNLTKLQVEGLTIIINIIKCFSNDVKSNTKQNRRIYCT